MSSMRSIHVPKTYTGVHRGVTYTVTKASNERWTYSFSVEGSVKIGTVTTRLGLMAVRRVCMLIDRARRVIA